MSQTPAWRHVCELIALGPAYNESENEIMRTYLSFKHHCKEETQVCAGGEGGGEGKGGR